MLEWLKDNSPRLFIRKVLLDCGAVQADALTVDRLASLKMYSETAVIPRDSILATEVEWLNSIKADLVSPIINLKLPSPELLMIPF
ncbi:L-arabinokinase-like [Thalictrum thalictroides]|uniref:L-arabinokinase-like n=1 Tax=Thalictrum thalictroides TaxID=46969 RepID=A0A7J6VNY6_THATH|nr:L-arabinokinase-like [Thalictrum thalictroides]